MRRLAAIVLALLALLLALLVALPFTESGSRLLASLATRYSPLELDFSGGRLFGPFALQRLYLPLGAVQLELRGVRADLDPACLWQSQFCFRALEIDELRILPLGPAAADPGPAGGPKRRSLEFPFRLVAPEVAIARSEIRWRGGHWRQEALELDLVIEAQALRIERAQVDEARLLVESSPDAGSQTVELPALWLPFELSVDELVLNQAGWDIGGNAGQLERLEVSARWRGAQLAVSRLAARQAGWGSLAMQGALTFSDAWPLSASAEVQVDEALHEQTLRLGSFSVQARGDLSALQLELRSDGAQPLLLRAQLDTLSPDLPFEARATLSTGESLDLAELVSLPGDFPPVALLPPLQLRAEGSLQAQALKARLRARGLGYRELDVLLDAEHRDGGFTVRQLSLQEVGEGSALFASGALQLGDTLEARLRLDSPGMTLPEISDRLFGRVRGALSLSAQIGSQAWSADLRELDLAGEINGLPASAEGSLRLDSSHYLAGGDLRFELNGARGRVRDNPDAAGAELQLTVDDLGRWQRDSRGVLTARATLAGPGHTLEVEAALEDAAWAGWRLSSAQARAAVALERPDRIRGTLIAREFGRGELQLQQLDLSLVATGRERVARLDLRGDIEGALDLAVHPDGKGWLGRLAPTALDTPLGRWQLPGEVSLRWADSELQVEDHCWRRDIASLCLSAASLGRSGQLELALDSDLELLAPLATEDLSLQGRLQGELVTDWSAAGALQARARLEISAGALVQHLPEGERATWGWEAIAASARYSAGELVLEAGLQREGREVLGLQAALPADPQQALSGELRVARLQLAPLRPFVPALSRLEGDLDGNLALEGTPVAPLATGRLSWERGALGVYSSPSELTGLSLALDLRGDHLQLAGSGLLGGGRVGVEGGLLTRPEWALELAISGQRNRLLYPPSIEAVVSPDLKIRARDGQVSLGGRIRVEEGLVKREQLPEGSIELSRDVVQVDYAGKVVEEERPFATSMDLRVAIADRLRIQGGGLDARVGGDLQLQQQPGRPLQLYGNLRVVGGEFRAYGQHLNIEKGRISFAGVPENPELDLRAERQIPLEQVTAGVRVTGTLEAPQLEVYTDPPMPQTDALSYLVRGRGLDRGAGSDGAALALSLGTGLVNRSAVVEGLNRLPGLSNVEFGAEGSADDTAATVSAYIGERIYLSYGVGLYEPVNVLTARLYLQTRLWLEVVSRLESSVDLYYSFDID